MPPHRETDFASAVQRPAANVVVIDDDPEIVETLSALLGGQGFAVEGYTDPRLALDRLRDGPSPDVVLSDCIMPRLTGAELAEALSAAGVDAPVVFMTALADPEFCVDTGRMRVLNKPFLLEDLIAEIDAATRPMSGPRVAFANGEPRSARKSA